MGTRGLWGFVLVGDEKLTYNHWDSYPEGLGQTILTWLRDVDLDALKRRVESIRLVDDGEGHEKPTPEEIERLRKYHDGHVSTGDPTEWYSLLRKTQGDPEATLESGVMIESSDFALDSLFCEWGYVIDLDANRFEVYRGFQKEPHSEGRFWTRSESPVSGEYWAIRLVASWPLDDLPTEGEFLAGATSDAEVA